MNTQQFSTFTLGDLFFGVEVSKVQEVVHYHQMTYVPLAPPEIKGLINLRGHIVTALDLRKRLGMPDREETQRLPINVVVRCGEHLVSLIVDEIGDVLDVEQDAFENPPETLTGVARELIRGAYKLDQRLLLILDSEKALSVGGGTEMSTV